MSRRQREVTSASSATVERRRVFLRFAPIVCFVELSTGYKLCCASHQLQVFQRMAPVASFAALGTGNKLCCASHQLQVFQRMAPVACFTALGTGYKLCCASQQLQVFLRFARVASFPAHGTGCKFSALHTSYKFPALGTGCKFSRAWHRLQIFPPLAPVASFPALDTDKLLTLVVTIFAPDTSYIVSHTFHSQGSLVASAWGHKTRLSLPGSETWRRHQFFLRDRFYRYDECSLVKNKRNTGETNKR